MHLVLKHHVCNYMLLRAVVQCYACVDACCFVHGSKSTNDVRVFVGVVILVFVLFSLY